MFRRPTTVRCSAPAKLNLFLEVIGRRSDGFHEIRTVMTPIDLCDTIEVTPMAGPDIQLDCRPVPGHPWWQQPSLEPAAAENLVVRAIQALQSAMGVQQGAAVRLIKRIPIAAGMGGGSSDAAAALWAANCVWRAGCSLAQLQEVAAGLGSDMPFFLAPAPALCTGRGEWIERLLRLPTLTWIVVAPREGNLTRDVYDRCRIPSRPTPLPSCIESERSVTKQEIQELLFNRLERPAAELNPWSIVAAWNFNVADYVTIN